MVRTDDTVDQAFRSPGSSVSTLVCYEDAMRVNDTAHLLGGTFPGAIWPFCRRRLVRERACCGPTPHGQEDARVLSSGAPGGRPSLRSTGRKSGPLDPGRAVRVAAPGIRREMVSVGLFSRRVVDAEGCVHHLRRTLGEQELCRCRVRTLGYHCGVEGVGGGHGAPR